MNNFHLLNWTAYLDFPPSECVYTTVQSIIAEYIRVDFSSILREKQSIYFTK